MQVKVGDYIKIRTDFVTRGCPECIHDLTFWNKNKVKVVEIMKDRRIVVERMTGRIGGLNHWFIELVDVIPCNLVLENK